MNPMVQHPKKKCLQVLKDLFPKRKWDDDPNNWGENGPVDLGAWLVGCSLRLKPCFGMVKIYPPCSYPCWSGNKGFVVQSASG